MAGPLVAQEATREVVEMSLGAVDAPVTLVEYASLTCPHCANFSNDVLPQLKANYIDTGKVRLIYREVYFDRPGLWAAMVARCAGEDRYFGVLDLFFRDQAAWSQAPDAAGVVDGLKAIGRQAGMTDADGRRLPRRRPVRRGAGRRVPEERRRRRGRSDAHRSSSTAKR